MDSGTTDSSTSGYLSDSFEGISSIFTDIETLKISGSNVLSKAKRYGKWWLLKSLTGNKAEEELYRQRLRKEFEILTKLQHPGIVTAVSLEDVDSLGKCIVMEYIDGYTLDKWLEISPSRSRRRAVADSVVEALEYVHFSGIVHRDLKPTNIMVTRSGDRVKLIDFGLADSDCHAVLKHPAGTLEYMSPEQLSNSEADPRNDIYSLGKVFSRMDLGYNRLVKKCLKPIDSRYQNLSELKKDMTNGKRVIFTVSSILLVLLVLIICTLSIKKRSDQKTVVQKEQSGSTDSTGEYKSALLYDSVNAANVDEKTSGALTPLMALPDISLPPAAPTTVNESSTPSDSQLRTRGAETAAFNSQVTLTNENYSEIHAQEMKNPKVREAANKAKDDVDKLFMSMDVFKHVDTLTDIHYFRDDLTFDDPKYGRFYKDYFEQLKKSFTPNQTLLIMGEISQEADNLKKRRSDKIGKLTLKAANESLEKLLGTKAINHE